MDRSCLWKRENAAEFCNDGPHSASSFHEPKFGTAYLRTCFHELISKIIHDPNLNLELDPMKIETAAMVEAQKGDPDAAVSNSEVRAVSPSKEVIKSRQTALQMTVDLFYKKIQARV